MKTPEELEIAYRVKVAEAYEAGNEAIKDQVVDTSKLIKPTDTVSKEKPNCMIAHFENEDYKISVMAPGILPKDDGGELRRGHGLIVYDISKKVL